MAAEQRGGVVADEVKTHELAEVDYISGMKYQDIADKYGVSINTVKSWKKRYAWNREKGAHKKKNGCIQKNIHQEKGEEIVCEEINDVMRNSELTDKQRLFCILYVRSFNATKAYQKAFGCAYNTAAVNGHKLLRNAKIKNEIDSLKQNRLNREMLKEDDIVQRYIDIAYADINDYVRIKNGFIMLKDSDTFDGMLVKKVSTGKIDSIELYDGMKALQWLSDHMDLATEKQKAEIAALRAKVDTESEEGREKKQQAKDNIASILDQLRDIEEGDVYE